MLSHACWLLTYPPAGWLGARTRLPADFAVLTLIAAAATVTAMKFWPARDSDVLPHVHTNLDPVHPHAIRAAPAGRGFQHKHAFVLDREHARRPMAQVFSQALVLPPSLVRVLCDLSGWLSLVGKGPRGQVAQG